MGTRKPQHSEHEGAPSPESSADADPYLVGLARQGRPRFKRRTARDEAGLDKPAHAGDPRDQDPYLVGLARHARDRNPADS